VCELSVPDLELRRPDLSVLKTAIISVCYSVAYPACSKRSDRLFRTGAMACLLAAPWVQLSVSAGNGWPHNALRHRWLIMPISCHFRDCKTLLVTSLTHVSGAGYSKCPDPFKDHYIFSNRPLSANFYRAMLCTSAAYAVVHCLSVRPSITFVYVYCVKTTDRILKLKTFYTFG